MLEKELGLGDKLRCVFRTRLTFFVVKLKLECSAGTLSLSLLPVLLAENVQLNVSEANSFAADSLEPSGRRGLMGYCKAAVSLY